jgi:hypothetical protein
MKENPAIVSRRFSRSWMRITYHRLSQVMAFAAAIFVSAASSLAQTAKKPNILVVFGDDIGIANLSAYTRGLVGYHTPNIDRIAKEGTMLPTAKRKIPAR